MEFIIIILIVAVIVLAVIISRNKEREYNPRLKVSIDTNYRGGSYDRYDPERAVNTGEIKQLEDETFCINPWSPHPLTLKGLSATDAKEMKEMLDMECQWQRRLSEITFLIAKQNIQCVELERFIAQARSDVSTYIEKRKQESSEWAQSSEKDKDDLMQEFQIDSLENLATKPSNDRALKILVFDAPGDLTVDDKLLDVFSGNEHLYSFYVSNLGWKSGVYQVSADDYRRENWEYLVDIGLAKRGKNIPVEALLDNLRMKDINDYFSDRLEKKFTRKAHAVEFAIAQPDAISVLSKHMSFREKFQLSEPEGIEISEIEACYRYAGAQAEVIRDTYVAGYRVLETVQDARGANYDKWTIGAEGCCKDCLKLNGKESKRKPTKLPPFHIGCTCSLNATYN